MVGYHDKILMPGMLAPRVQPIFSCGPFGRSLFAYECLTRGPAGTHLERADLLFHYVRRHRLEARVDRACVHGAIAGAAAVPLHVRLSINVHASTLASDPRFPDYICHVAAIAGVVTSRLIVEIVEHSPRWDMHRLRASLNELRAAGIQIALDDFGVGHSNYRMVLECQPDYLKIERFFVQGCGKDADRRAIIQTIIELARALGADVIAEGVESQEDLACVRAAGITLAQGFLFASPHAFPAAGPAPQHTLAVAPA